MFLVGNLYAQESEALLNNDKQSKTSITGFGGPLIFATHINNELGLSIGGKGGAVFNEKFAFGGIGFGMVSPPGFSGNNLSDNVNTPMEMTFGAGGIFFEYILKSGDFIKFSFPLNLMAGGINIYESGMETEIESSAFFIFEPGISIDFKLSEHFTPSIYMSYRQALGSSLINLEDKDISGLNIGLMLKFGNTRTKNY